MNTSLQLQDYLFKGMLSCDFFNMFNVVLERQFLMQSVLEFNAIWQQPRTDTAGKTDANGIPLAPGKPVDGAKVGAGFYIEIPKLQVPRPNSRQRFLVASIVSLEERNLNMTPEFGTQMEAEDMAELALDFMWAWVLNFSSALVPESDAILPARDLQADGLVAYRTSVSLRVEKVPPQRCDQPAIVQQPGGQWTIQNGANTPDAVLYYTLDNSFPGRANVNAQVYNAPLVLPAGTILNAMAWRADRLPSHIAQVKTS